MLFNSLHYLVFFPVVVTLHFILPHRWRWLLLLLSSYYFYMSWKAEYALLLLLSTGVAYAAGRALETAETAIARKAILWGSVSFLLGVLFTFKYFNFSAATLRYLAGKFDFSVDVPLINVLLPIGISFYTFQKISYVVDVYHREVKPERHFGIFAVYSCFFPQLVAGPIERAQHLLHQFYERHEFNSERTVSGLRLILWGLFKKIVVADRLALLIQAVYNDPTHYTGLPLTVATFFFAFQIYCDFSGYTDIAIGSAKVLGFELTANFRQPYFSQSIPEFWRRWHISLSSWFRQYVYIPLGGNRVGKTRWYYNIFITFLVSGLWHGANWTFAIWGALHGVYMILDAFLAPLRQSLTSRITSSTGRLALASTNILITFCLVTIAWIPFRANTLDDTLFIVSHLFSGAGSWFDLSVQYINFRGAGIDLTEMLYSLLSIGIVITYDIIDARSGFEFKLCSKPRPLRWTVYYAFLLTILFFAPYNQAKNFIYFQF